MPAYAKWLLKVAFSLAILYVIVAKSNLREILATLQLIAPVSVLIALMGLIGGLLWLIDRREFATLGAVEAQVASNMPIGASEGADSPGNR